MPDNQTTVPAPETLWRARDGRLMKFEIWLADRAKPTALMTVINPGPRMKKVSEQSADGFGTFLLQEEPQKMTDNPTAASKFDES